MRFFFSLFRFDSVWLLIFKIRSFIVYLSKCEIVLYVCVEYIIIYRLSKYRLKFTTLQGKRHTNTIATNKRLNLLYNVQITAIAMLTAAGNGTNKK